MALTLKLLENYTFLSDKRREILNELKSGEILKNLDELLKEDSLLGDLANIVKILSPSEDASKIDGNKMLQALNKNKMVSLNQ